MPEQWTADLAGKMHLNYITAKQLSTRLGYSPKFPFPTSLKEHSPIIYNPVTHTVDIPLVPDNPTDGACILAVLIDILIEEGSMTEDQVLADRSPGNGKFVIGGIAVKATGIIRRIDNTGRIVVPVELRKINGIANGDPIEFYTDNEENIILHKYVPIEDWTKEELREALFAAAKDAGKDPEEYLNKVREEGNG